MAFPLHRANRLTHGVRQYSRISIPRPAWPDPVIRVVNNVARLGSPKDGPKPRQLLSLPPFPSHPLPARCSMKCLGEKQSTRVTAISWVKYYFDEVLDSVIQSHFNKGLVKVQDSGVEDSSSMRKRFDPIPSGTLNPNADEIAYLQRLVKYKDSAIIVLNKPPKLPLRGNLAVHNSMVALAAAALSYDNEEGPRLSHGVKGSSAAYTSSKLLGKGADGDGQTSNEIEKPKDQIFKRKQQREAVDALLSSSLISSKKPEKSSKTIMHKRSLSPSSKGGDSTPTKHQKDSRTDARSLTREKSSDSFALGKKR